MKPESTPPATETSVTVKFVAAALRVNVIEAVWPAFRVDMLDAIAIDGLVASIAIVDVNTEDRLLAAEPSLA